MFRMHEHVRAAEPGPSSSWRETWLDRVEQVGRGHSSSTRVWKTRRTRSSAAAASCSRSTSAIRAQVRDRGADRQRGAADGDHVAQLPPGPLRTRVRHPDRRRRGGPHRVRRLRPRADGPRALSPARLRPRRVARPSAQGARPVTAAALEPRLLRRMRVIRSMRRTAPGRRRTATSISGSSCCTRPARAARRAARSRSPSTSRATSGRSSSFRTPTSTRSTASTCSS